MEQVFERSKEYEVVVTERDPVYKDLLIGIEIVKKFVADNGLILYGGSSIDYALRLHGDKIYPDNLPPDLDFYSPKNVEHAYQLADLLYYRGYKDARAINAQHMETMRVDLVDNHFIADITYRPPEVFDKLPTLVYNGMKIIHPLFQRIDLHSSLAFPYDNVPREVIFERWNKDIKRFNLLDKYFPVAAAEPMKTREVKAPAVFKKYVLSGFAAYAIIYHAYARDMKELGADVDPRVTPAKFAHDSAIVFDTLDQKMEIVHFDPEKAADELGLNGVKKYETYIHIIPETVAGNVDATGVVIYSTRNRLVSANSVKVGEQIFRIVNVQYLLKHFIAMYFMHTHAQSQQPKLANTYLDRYASLLRMITGYEDALVAGGAESRAVESALFPTIETYGRDNRNLASEVALNRLYNELDGVELLSVPRNYYPGRSIAKGVPHPEFVFEGNPFFMELGREIKIE